MAVTETTRQQIEPDAQRPTPNAQRPTPNAQRPTPKKVNSTTLPKRQLTNLVLCLAVVPLLGWWLTGLFDLDEGFYAAVVGEMNRRSEWITPYYNGHPWFEKPILAYWLAKPFVAIFGDILGPRMPSVLCTIGCYLLVAWYARRRISEDAATWSVLALSTSLVFVAVGRLMMTDMPLVLAFSGAMLTFWESLVGDRRWRIATAGFLGIAVLAKGPVGLILFAVIAVWTYWRQPKLRPAFRGHWLTGTALLAAVIATWYVPVYLANGQTFVQEFLIEQNLGRFTGGDKAHTIKAAWAYLLYIPVIFIGMAPWSVWLWKAWPRRGLEPVGAEELLPEGRERPSTEIESFRHYLAGWGAIVFLFFSASGAKLPHYVLPAFLPFAMLVGTYLAGQKPLRDIRGIAWPVAWCVVLAVVVNGGLLWWYEASGQREAHMFANYIRENSVSMVPKTVAMFQLPRRKKELGTGKPELQETSLPSFLLYLNSTATEAETVKQVNDADPHWLFTRRGRITAEVRSEFWRLGKRLDTVGPTGRYYELYELAKPGTPP